MKLLTFFLSALGLKLVVLLIRFFTVQPATVDLDVFNGLNEPASVKVQRRCIWRPWFCLVVVVVVVAVAASFGCVFF